jgi:diamine N-acetyltransferase
MNSSIRGIQANELALIQTLAHRIWPDTFREILSPEQIDYMLRLMYDIEVLQKQFSEGHRFFLYNADGAPVGFMVIEPRPEESMVKIHKLYVLPEAQGKGVGKGFLQFCESWARRNNFSKVCLNVNRFNKAVGFYRRMGMEIVREEDIDIGEGFLMEDYVLEKRLDGSRGP